MDTGKKRPKGPEIGLRQARVYVSSMRASGWRSSPKAYPSSCAKGKTVDFKELLRMEPDGGTTNVRNVKSKHWTR
jgi:hypothetical protein